jgi:hypothetical protein
VMQKWLFLRSIVPSVDPKGSTRRRARENTWSYVSNAGVTVHLVQI